MKNLIPLILVLLLLTSCGIVGIKSNYESPTSSQKVCSYDLKANYILPQYPERNRSEFEKEVAKKLEPVSSFLFGKRTDAHSPDLSTYLNEKLLANGKTQRGTQTAPQYHLEFNYVVQEVDQKEWLHLISLGIVPEEIHLKVIYEIKIKDKNEKLVFQDSLNDLIKVKFRETWGRIKLTQIQADTWELQKKHAYHALTQALAKFH